MKCRSALRWLVRLRCRSVLSHKRRVCPQLDTANSRLQARAAFLIDDWNLKNRVPLAPEYQISSNGLDLAIALFGVVAAIRH